LYPRHQQFRERVLADFPHTQIIQLPQSVYFGDRATVGRAREAVQRHPRFTLIVRDEASRQRVCDDLGVSAVLCPDMAFALGSVIRPRRPEVDVLGLCRSDIDSSLLCDQLAPFAIPLSDWLQDDPSVVRNVVKRLEGMERDRPRVFGWTRGASSLAFDTMALERLERGMRVIERARTVITDRLHGHILCLLAGIPHVILDTGYGKVHAFHATWTAESPLVKSAETAEAAVALAQDFVRRRVSGDFVRALPGSSPTA
jgi:pyruvyl transferase EpsO